MTEITEEQLAKNKAAVDSMRAAKSNMVAALVRIAQLEGALSEAANNLKACKEYVPTKAYLYEGKVRLTEVIQKMENEARRHL